MNELYGVAGTKRVLPGDALVGFFELTDLMNAGTSIQQLSACFVILSGLIESIYDAIKYGAIVQQTGAGREPFSNLRPGDIVRSTGGSLPRYRS